MSVHFGGPAERARMSGTGMVARSRRRRASSRESSSKGLRLCFMLVVSIAVWVLLTRGLIWGVFRGGVEVWKGGG